MKIIVKTFIFTILVSCKLWCQSNSSFSIPCDPYIDKIFITKDKEAILRNKIKIITIYQSTLSDSGFTEKSLVGKISFSGDSLLSRESWGTVFENCLPITKRVYKKDKIICYSGCKPNTTCNMYKQTNYLDPSGKIIRTINLLTSKQRLEDQFDYDKIEYKYFNDLLTECVYYNSWRYVNKNQIYKKLYFEYE